jgi:hypothetical protein
MGLWQRGQPPRALQVKDAKDVHTAFSRKSRMLAMQAGESRRNRDARTGHAGRHAFRSSRTLDPHYHLSQART